MQSSVPAVFDVRQKSLIRGSLLVVSSLCAAVLLSDFPHNRATLLLLLPAVVAMLGTADTVRCMRQRWNFYHAGVVLCVYMDLMALCMIFFFLIYPYWLFHSIGH